MPNLPISLACWDYDRVRGLMDGSITVPGVDLRFVCLPVEEIFWRQLVHQEFDVSEMSFSSYLMARDRGTPKLTAIPVFISRFFRHGNVFINTHKNIQSPVDLRGKRVGIPEYQMTASVWIRGFLEDDYGVQPSEIVWVQGGEDTPGRPEKPGLNLPPEIRVERAGPGESLNNLLERGEIDAMISARVPPAFSRGSQHIARLFPDFIQEEQAYFERTGIFPIMHVMVIRDAVLEANPWVANNLFKAFIRAKKQALTALSEMAANKVTLPWVAAELARAQSLMGEDFWPYGLSSNRTSLEAFIRYSRHQGLTHSDLKPEDLFVKSTLDEFYSLSDESY